MESAIGIWIAADPDTVFRLAQDVEGWPRLLTHYRWVRRLAASGDCQVLDMAARRDLIPVRWTAILQPFPHAHRLRFLHIGGPTRGMSVEWRITPRAGGAYAEIWHRFRPPLPLIGEVYAHHVVGRFFIDSIAGRTLRGIKREAERGDHARPRRMAGPRLDRSP